MNRSPGPDATTGVDGPGAISSVVQDGLTHLGTVRRFRILSALVVPLIILAAAALPGSAATVTPNPAETSVNVTGPVGLVVSHLGDRRLTAPSSLAISAKNPDIAYTMNDEGTGVVYSFELATGRVVGTTILYGTTVKKAVGMVVDDGKLWIADVGDRNLNRFGGMIYSIDEPESGTHQVTPRAYQVWYGGDSQNMQTLLVNPKTHTMYLASRNDVGSGTLWRLPNPLSSTLAINRATQVADSITPAATDGAFTPNASRVLILTDKDIHVFDPRSWKELAVLLPTEGTVDRGRGLAMSPDATSFYTINEAVGSAISKFALTKAEGGVATSTEVTPTATAPRRSSVAVSPVLVYGGLIALGVVLVLAIRRTQQKAQPKVPPFPPRQ